MERKQDHSSCPGDIEAAHRRRTISNVPRKGRRQTAPASIESAPSLLRHDGSSSLDSTVTTGDESVSLFKVPLSSPSQQQAADAEESSQAKPKTFPLGERSENSSGSEPKSTPSPPRYQGAAGRKKARQKEPVEIPLEAGEVQGSARESKSSAPCSRVRERTGASATSRREPIIIPLEAVRHAVATALRSTTTEQDDPQMGLKKGFYDSPSQARKRAKDGEDMSTPSTSMGFTGTQGGTLSTRGTRDTAGGTSVTAQREYPRKKHSGPAPGRNSRARERVQRRGDVNVGASTSQGIVGIQARKRSSAAPYEATSVTSAATQLEGPRYYAPGHRQQSHLQEYAELEDSTASTSKRSLGIQGDHSPVASTSRGDLVPRDSQGPFHTKGHPKSKGDSDNQSAPEGISSGDEPSAVASSRATKGASAFPSKSYRNEFLCISENVSKKIQRRRMERAASRAHSDEVDPIEGTSRGTLSEPTPSTGIQGMVGTLRQMMTNAQELATEMRQLSERAVAVAHQANLQRREHAQFIRYLREKMDQEKMEQKKMKREKMEREKMEREKMEREKMEREKMEREKRKKKKKTKKTKKTKKEKK